jgi:hypothetical protein
LPLQAILAVREAVQVSAPELVVAPEPEEVGYTACATALITRWEVSSKAAYERKWSGIYYPAGPITPSGPTGGLGYDFGHNTGSDIRRDWRMHDAVERLVTASGVIGISAKQRIREWAGITVPYPMALSVFGEASLPSYTAGARRLYGRERWEALPSTSKCGLVSNGYNRGFGTAGPRRAEIRERAQVCMPLANIDAQTECLATSLEAERRLWPDNRGLRDRRTDEARVVRNRRPAAPAAPAPPSTDALVPGRRPRFSRYALLEPLHALPASPRS